MTRSIMRPHRHRGLAALVIAASLLVMMPAITLGAESGSSGRFVLQVAIERYRWAPPLAGPRADIRDLREVLVRRYGFRPGDFRVLVDSQATRDGILAAIREQLVDNARRHPGALCVLHFSGHGSRVRDLEGEPWEPDGWDETLVPWDGRDPDERHPDVLDDELAEQFEQLSRYTSRIVLIFDACHAGTLTRGLRNGRAVNGLPPPGGVAPRPAGVRASESAFGVALFASPPGQRSWVEDIGGEARSVFTYHLVRALEHASSRTTYSDLLASVGRAIRARYGEQVPFGEGPLDQPVLAGAAPDEDADLGARADGPGWVRIEAGALQGITLESTIAIREPHGPTGTYAKGVVAEGVVVEVGASSCRARVDPSITIPEGARAFLRRAGVSGEPVRFVWAIPDGAFPWAAPLRQALQDRLRDDPLIRVEPPGNSADAAPVLGDLIWRASEALGDCPAGSPPRSGLALVLANGVVALERVLPSPRAALADTLERLLRCVALAEHVRRLDSSGDSIASGIDLGLVVTRHGPDGALVVDTLLAGAMDRSIAPGDTARVFIAHRGTRRACVAVLHVGPDRSSEVVFPEAPTGVIVEPGVAFVDHAALLVEPPCGLDHLKLVVTDRPVDLGRLLEPIRTRSAAPPPRGGALERLLWNAGGLPPRRGAETPIEWGVRDLVVPVRAP